MLYPPRYYCDGKFRTHEKWKKRAFAVLPVVVCAVKLVLCFSFLFQDTARAAVYNITTLAFFLLEALKNLILFYQNVVRGGMVKELFVNFGIIEKNFKRDFCVEINYNKFIRVFSLQMAAVVILYAALAAVLGIQYKLGSGITTTANIWIKLFQLLNIFLTMNAVFVIDLLNYDLKHFNSVITGRRGSVLVTPRIWSIAEHRTEKSMRQQIRKFKQVHFKFWTICNQINRIYGWTITVTMLQGIMDVCYIAYTQLNALQQEFDILRVLCKRFIRPSSRVNETLYFFAQIRSCSS